MKNTFYISCPIDTYSGYGSRSRDLVKTIIESDKYDVKIIPQRWGNTAWGYIKDHSEKWGFLEQYLYKQPQLDKQPDIWAQITVPNEFQPVGKYNIGITAGMETTGVHHTWVEGVNRMNLTLVPSEHSKTTFLNSVFQQQNQQGQVVGEIKVNKPIEVLFEGVDLDTFVSKKGNFPLEIKEDFAYLCVGHWLQGDFGEDRKNIAYTIKAFLEVFKNKKKAPALILKTPVGNSSYMGRDELVKRVEQLKSSVNSTRLPSIYILNGDLSEEQLNELYNHPKVKAFMMFTKGEGYGRPLLEFSLSKKPILTTNWSGHIDFLKKDFCCLVNGELKNVHPSAAQKDMILQEFQWFTPNDGEVGFYIKDVYENYKKYQELAKRQAYHSKENFSLSKMGEKLMEILEQNVPEIAQEVKLELPKLQLPKLKKIDG
jgi:glycosyltransferase involved in cell wall biosynthesis